MSECFCLALQNYTFFLNYQIIFLHKIKNPASAGYFFIRIQHTYYNQNRLLKLFY